MLEAGHLNELEVEVIVRQEYTHAHIASKRRKDMIVAKFAGEAAGEDDLLLDGSVRQNVVRVLVDTISDVLDDFSLARFRTTRSPDKTTVKA